MSKPTIHRFPLKGAGLNKINMPEGGIILKAGITSTGVSLWAIVDPAKEMKPRYFQLFKTGEEMPDWAWDAHFIEIPGAPAVHLFEVEAAHLKPA